MKRCFSYFWGPGYNGSMDLEPEQVLLYLSMGRRKPQNEHEERLLKQIREIESKGRSVEIPFNGL